MHEVKYDGYRIRLERDGDSVRLITKGGYNWTSRYPWIVEAALKNRFRQFVIDGEAVILGVDGRSDFDALHSGRHNEEVQLYAFDMLAGDGDDIRQLPLQCARPEQGEIGPDLFRRLEGLVSKRRDRPYRAGPSPYWVKVEEPNPSRDERVMEALSRP
jgi:bifunctional non-homologous end joining protein LigD